MAKANQEVKNFKDDEFKGLHEDMNAMTEMMATFQLNLERI